MLPTIARVSFADIPPGDRCAVVLVWKQLQQGSFRWPPIVDGVMKLSPVEFAALFDGLDWTRVQASWWIPTPTAAA